jgi:predicted GH43/DUF377 family glycosyl hydrolase
MMNAPLPIERLNDGKPLLQKMELHPWENKTIFNPACAYVRDRRELASIIHTLPFDDTTREGLGKEGALCFLLYRAQGKRTADYDYTRSSIGLAVLTADLKLLARHTEPVITPDQEYEDLGAEDGRITKIGDRYVMLYCAYGSGMPANRIRIAAASTVDFVQWEKHGLLKGDFNEIDNKNAMLFPGRIDKKLLLLHRPMQGPDAMAIHWAEADELAGPWKSRGVLMKPIPNSAFIDTWIGGGAPPVSLPDGRFLILYHIGNRKEDGSREYDLGIALADPATREIIVKRHEPMMRPETYHEMNGDAELGVNNVVFLCGAYFHQDNLYFPYAGADSVVLGGQIPKGVLEQFLRL